MPSVSDMVCNLFRNAIETLMNMTQYDKIDYMGP